MKVKVANNLVDAYREDVKIGFSNNHPVWGYKCNSCQNYIGDYDKEEDPYKVFLRKKLHKDSCVVPTVIEFWRI